MIIIILLVVILMKINELCEYLGIQNKEENRIISDVVTSTKDVKENCVLILTKGFNVNPINYLTLSIRRKCLLILSDDPCEGCIYIPDLKDKVFVRMHNGLTGVFIVYKQD